MPSDFEAELRNSLNDLNSKVSALSKTFVGSKERAREFGDEVKKNFHTRSFSGASEGAEDLRHQIEEIGHALKAGGGMIGELAHSLTGALRFAGPLALIAAGAKVASEAMEILQSRSEAVQERIAKISEAANEMGHSVYDATRKADEAKAGDADSQGTDLRKFLARGGSTAEADTIAGDNTGLAYDDVIKGLTALQDIPVRFQRGVKAAALKLSSTGEMSFTDAIEEFHKSPYLAMQAGSGSKTDSDRAMQMMLLQSRGLLPTAENRRSVADELSGRFMDRPEISGLNASIVAKNNKAMLTRDALTDGTMDRVNQEMIAGFIDPLRDVSKTFNLHTEEQLSTMKKQIESMGLLTRAIDKWNYKVYGKGLQHDYETQKAAADAAAKELSNNDNQFGND